MKRRRAGRAEVKRRIEEVRGRLAAGEPRAAIVADCAARWGISPAAVENFLRPLRTDTQVHADARTIRNRMQQVRARLNDGMCAADIARELAAKWGVTRLQVAKYVRRVRRAARDQNRWPKGTNRDGRMRMTGRTAVVREWIQAGLDAEAAVARAQAEWGVCQEQARRYMRRAWAGCRRMAGSLLSRRFQDTLTPGALRRRQNLKDRHQGMGAPPEVLYGLGLEGDDWVPTPPLPPGAPRCIRPGEPVSPEVQRLRDALDEMERKREAPAD